MVNKVQFIKRAFFRTFYKAPLVFFLLLFGRILRIWPLKVSKHDSEMTFSEGNLYGNYSVNQKGEMDLEKSSYFQSGTGLFLKEQLIKSNGKELRLRSYQFSTVICDYQSPGAIYYSSNPEADNELSTGKGFSLFESLMQKDPIFIEDCYLIVQRNSALYSHFLLEVMASLFIWCNNISDNVTIAINAPNYVKEYLKIFGFNNKIINIGYRKVVYGKNIRSFKLLPPSYFSGSLIKKMSGIAHSKVKQKFSNPSNVVFITRLESENRRIKNLNSVIDVVKKKYPHVDFFRPGSLSIEEQISRMKSAEVVLGQHGSHLTNIIWSEKLRFHIEFQGFFPDKYPDSKLGIDESFTSLCRSMGGVAIKVDALPVVSGDICSDIEVDLEKLREVLNSLPDL